LGTSLPDQEVLGPIEFQDDVLVEKWPGGHTMGTFDQLVASRRRWIDQELAPWCRAAARVDLVKAADEWLDIAGKVDAESTLWTWAWSRFPVLVCDDMPGVNETNPVRLVLADGRQVSGFPDARVAGPGRLVVIDTDDPQTTHGPISIDEIISVEAT